MSYMFAVGRCVVCRLPITFNPHLVPSIRVRFEGAIPVRDPSGEREPLCRACVAMANARARDEGLPEFTIPEGAYEPSDEGGL